MKVLIGILSFFLCQEMLFSSEGKDLQLEAQQKKMALTEEENETLEKGDLSGVRYVIGSSLGTVLGLGTGHAVQGRWSRDGWKFTLGETVGFSALMIGASLCSTDPVEGDYCQGKPAAKYTALTGYFLFGGIRIWEMVDVWMGGYFQMKEYDYLKEKIKTPNPEKTALGVIPLLNHDFKGIGVVYTF